MPDGLVPIEQPTISQKTLSWLGVKLPTLALPQIVKNIDKALGRIIEAGGTNIASRIDRSTSHIEAQKKGEVRIIDASSEYIVNRIADHQALADRALQFSFGESVLKQHNREAIAKLAIEDLTAKHKEPLADATSEIDDDWLNSFSDLASHKSNSEIQTLWAKILSGKIRQPSSFSLQSLQLLSSLDTRDAHLIHEVLSYAILRLFIYKAPVWKDISKFITCEDLGVLSGTSGLVQMTFEQPSQTPIPIQMSETILIAKLPPNQLQIPCFNLTRFGKELLSLSDGFKRDAQYEQEFIDFLKANGATVQRIISGMPGQAVPVEDV